MYLKHILKGVALKKVEGLSRIKMNRITDDSRLADEADMFVAVRGYSVDGHSFIKDAIGKGAKIIVAENDFGAPKGVMKILVEDSRAAVSVMADNFYGHPSRDLKVIGVTGTNGKTTITYIIENILKAAGAPAGVIGTVNYRLKDKIMPSRNTTPGPLELQSLLAGMVKSGIGYAVMEVSSHSIDQRRVEGVFFDVGIFTNITSEHLDYHKTISDYFKAKALLFERLKKDGTAVLNADDEKVASLKNSIRHKVITYGIKKDADIKAEDIKLSMNGASFVVVTPRGSFKVNTRLMGMHNVSNILASAAAALELKISPKTVKEGIESVLSVPGRLETVGMGQDFRVFVDYAHTEDALFNVLGILRKVAPKRIITVFGCGGDRDRKKRPVMGKVACEFSDRVLITSDNPRSEEPLQIIDEIEGIIKGRFSNYQIEPDRRLAIEKALGLASKDDVVLIAGKGHEGYQIIRDKTMPFDDREVCRAALANLTAVKTAR